MCSRPVWLGHHDWPLLVPWRVASNLPVLVLADRDSGTSSRAKPATFLANCSPVGGQEPTVQTMFLWEKRPLWSHAVLY